MLCRCSYLNVTVRVISSLIKGWLWWLFRAQQLECFTHASDKGTIRIRLESHMFCTCRSLNIWLVFLRSIIQEASRALAARRMPYIRRCRSYLFELPVSYLPSSQLVFSSTWLTPENHQRCLWSWPLQSRKPPTPLQRRTPLLRQRLRKQLWRPSEILSPSRCLGQGLLRMVQKIQTLLLYSKELHCCKVCLFIFGSPLFDLLSFSGERQIEEEPSCQIYS